MRKLFGCLALIILIVIAILVFVQVRNRAEPASPASQPVAASQPTIKITWPQNGARVKVGQQFQVHAVATDPRGIFSIAIAVDGQPGTPGTASPPITTFSAVIPLTFQTKGVHTITVQANSTTGAKSDPASIKVVAVQNLSDAPAAGDPPTPVPEVPSGPPPTPSADQPTPANQPPPPPPPPGASVNFVANPTSIAQGQCSTLRWDVEGVREVYFEGVGVTGHEQRQQCPTQTTTYTLRVVFTNGSAQNYTQTVTVTGGNDGGTTCSGRPILAEFSIEPRQITEGQSATLSWGVINADSVQFDQGIGAVNLIGSRTVSPNRATTYTLTARCGAETVTRSLTLTVNPATTFTVSNVTVSVNRSSYNGSCPNTFTAGAKITANRAGTVRYRWERSDGTNSDTRTLQFDAAGEKAVTNYDWSIPSSGNYWVRLHILEPNDLVSNRGETAWTCTSGSGGQAPPAPRNCRGGASGTGVYLSWETTGSVRTWDGFRVYARGSNQPLKVFDHATTTAGQIDNLTPNTTYHLDVRAYNALGESPADACAVEVKTAAATTFQVTKVTAEVEPEIFTGTCPKSATYTGKITTNGAGTVSYRWVRSDGTSETRTLNFSAAGTQAVASINVNYAHSATHWAKLEVLAPNAMISEQAKFTLSCTSPPTPTRTPTPKPLVVTGVKVTIAPENYSGPCPYKVNYSGTISASAAGTVKYLWILDGTAHPTRELRFDGAGTKSVETGTWTVNAGTHTAQLKVIEPTETWAEDKIGVFCSK